MQDAVVLANCLYEMKSLAPADIGEALDTFKDVRYTRVKAQYNASKTDAQLIYGQVRILPTLLQTAPLLFSFFLFWNV